jgi:hypothetical protein
MRTFPRIGAALVLTALLRLPVHAQQQAPAQQPAAPAGDAATVNGQPISEAAVQRALRRVPPDKQAEARPEILNYLIDNTLVDQYLLQVRIEVPQKELDDRVQQIREELKKANQTFEKMLQELAITEQDLRTQLAAELRWERFAAGQANDQVVRELFDKNPEMFDGSMVRARHILLTAAAGDAQAAEQAKARLTQFKQQVEEAAAAEAAKQPASADNVTREKARGRALEESFAALARKESACPSKEQGGDIGWFPRAGSMVEPFARAAFALKPGEMSDVIASPFGVHVILVTDRRPGKETKFDDVKEVVKEVYSERMREALCAQLRPNAKIVINTPPKP